MLTKKTIRRGDIVDKKKLRRGDNVDKKKLYQERRQC